MIDFSLQHILQHAPYDITLSEAGFIFLTDNGIHYRVSFDEEDIVLGGCKTYQFILQNVEHARAPHDPKIEATVLAIIDEFFRSNQHIYCTYAILVMVKKAGATGSFCVGLSVMQALSNLLFALQKQR